MALWTRQQPKASASAKPPDPGLGARLRAPRADLRCPSAAPFMGLPLCTLSYAAWDIRKPNVTCWIARGLCPNSTPVVHEVAPGTGAAWVWQPPTATTRAQLRSTLLAKLRPTQQTAVVQPSPSAAGSSAAAVSSRPLPRAWPATMQLAKLAFAASAFLAFAGTCIGEPPAAALVPAAGQCI